MSIDAQKISPYQNGFVHCSPIGIIPKQHQPDKYRLIVDLSAPMDNSINDLILLSCACSSMLLLITLQILWPKQPKGAHMTKMDLHIIYRTYRMVPVHPVDQSLLGIQWERKIFTDCALPFGLRSAPKVFNEVADGLAWALLCSRVEHILH